MHLRLVTHHLRYVDDLLALKIVQKMSETCLNFFLVRTIIFELFLISSRIFSFGAVENLVLLLVLFYVDILAQLVDQDCFSCFAPSTISIAVLGMSL